MTEAQKLAQKVEAMRGDMKGELAGIRGSIDTLNATVKASDHRHGDEIKTLFGKHEGMDERLRGVELTYVKEDDFKPLVAEVGSMKTQVTKVMAIGGVILFVIEGVFRYFG